MKNEFEFPWRMKGETLLFGDNVLSEESNLAYVTKRRHCSNTPWSQFKISYFFLHIRLDFLQYTGRFCVRQTPFTVLLCFKSRYYL